MTWQIIFELALLGCCTGFLAGLLGIGGGMILTPFLTILLTGTIAPEHIIHVAIATSMGTILFTSISSVRSHAKRGAVLWKVAFLIAPGILVGSILGAQISSALPTKWIGLIFCVFVFFSATKMLMKSSTTASRALPGNAGLMTAGGIIGIISALVGAGGGFISVPFLTYCNVKIHQAIGTSAALGFPIALFGVVGYAISGWNVPTLGSFPHMLGYVDIPALFAVAITSVLTAPLGAKLSHSINTEPLKRIFAVMLYCLGCYMGYTALMH